MQVNRNSQTTSTKCQYQAAASKPKCRSGVSSPARARNQQTARNMVPTITWKPGKPVARKKADGIPAAPLDFDRGVEVLDGLQVGKGNPSRTVMPRPRIRFF